MAKILRNASQIIEEFRTKLQYLSEAINTVRNKVEQITNLFTLGSSGVSGFVQKKASKHAKRMVDDSTKAMNKAAKNAVDKAIKSTAKKMSKVAKDIGK